MRTNNRDGRESRKIFSRVNRVGHPGEMDDRIWLKIPDDRRHCVGVRYIASAKIQNVVTSPLQIVYDIAPHKTGRTSHQNLLPHPSPLPKAVGFKV